MCPVGVGHHGDGQGFFWPCSGNTLKVFMWHFGWNLGAMRMFVPFQCHHSSCPWSRGGDSWIGGCNISYALLDDTKVHFNA